MALTEYIHGKNTYEDFKKDTINLLLERNKKPLWESPEIEGKLNLQQLIEMLDESYNDELAHIKLYPFKTTGLRFVWKLMDTNNPPDELRLVVACKDGYHRNWEHHGICIKDTGGEP